MLQFKSATDVGNAVQRNFAAEQRTAIVRAYAAYPNVIGWKFVPDR